MICGYIDTIFLDLEFVIKTLRTLGWTINYEKSKLAPSNSIEYLGLIIDTSEGGIPILKVPKCKISKLKKDIKRIFKYESVTARVISKIAGQCIFLSKAILPGKLMLRNVYRILKSKDTWESKLVLDREAREDLEWWCSSMEAWNGRAVLPEA